MKLTLAVFFLLIAPGGLAAAEPPNIIFILTDDLGYGDVGAYGQQIIATPSIDRLAAEGMRFTDHYAGHPTCRPSRLSMLTGQHTGHTAVSRNGPHSLEPTDLTVAELLKQAGYTTGGVGKWTGGTPDDAGHPNLQGFDFWMGYLSQAAAHNYYPTHLWRNREQVRLAGNELLDDPRANGRVSEHRVTYSHDVITDEALGFIRRHRDEPFLLHVHWTIPHVNNERGAIFGDGQEVPDYGSYADRDWPDAEKGFAAMIERMDRDVGRIMALLAELGIDDRTLVIFTSDNGPHHGGGHQHQFFDSNGPLRGQKGSLNEGGIRVPMIARWPGRIEPGTTSDHVSAFWDFLPTACDIAGVEPPERIDGISYLPALLGGEQPQHEYLFWRIGDKSTAVRSGQWKYIRVGLGHRLYDLSTDLDEQQDVAEQHPEVLERLQTYAAAAVI